MKEVEQEKEAWELVIAIFSEIGSLSGIYSQPTANMIGKLRDKIGKLYIPEQKEVVSPDESEEGLLENVTSALGAYYGFVAEISKLQDTFTKSKETACDFYTAISDKRADKYEARLKELEASLGRWQRFYVMDVNMQSQEKQVAEAKTEAYREVGESLCCLIGNTMLKNTEQGKLLGDQLSVTVKWLQEKSGIKPVKEGE
jgi:hypothetical protein